MYIAQRQIVDDSVPAIDRQHLRRIVGTDMNGVVRFLNPSAAQLLSRSLENVIGRPLGIPVVGGDFTEIDLVRNDPAKPAPSPEPSLFESYDPVVGAQEGSAR